MPSSSDLQPTSVESAPPPAGGDGSPSRPSISSVSADAVGESEAAPFTSSHTSNFPEILRQLGISLLVTTYQAGKLIIVRPDGDSLNTHFRNFPSPMGLAYDPAGQRLAVGTRDAIWHFRNHPRAAAKLEPAGRCDAAFLPTHCHFSGDIRIHEIAWIGGEIWAVNTRFSCLSTFDARHSFVPRWRPPFISGLSPDDRCHLNGMAVVDGRIRFLTCLGTTDGPAGWRANKATGGCLLDYPGGEVVLAGLSMPHSPRRHMDRFWILESGIGSLSTFDPGAGTKETVARLPGFTRGIDFCGRLAFIGLSQVRESAIFSGIPLVDQMPERSCGIWAVDLITGQTVAFLKFEGAVQEIFSVQVLPGITFPDLINEPGETLDSSFVLPDESLPDVLQAPLGAGIPLPTTACRR